MPFYRIAIFSLSALMFSALLCAETAELKPLTRAQIMRFMSDRSGLEMDAWVSEPDDQRAWKRRVDGDWIPVVYEGKCEDGQVFYRKGYKRLRDAFPDAKPFRWCCFTGMNLEGCDPHAPRAVGTWLYAGALQRFQRTDRHAANLGHVGEV